jgi:hypothetical protein
LAKNSRSESILSIFHRSNRPNKASRSCATLSGSVMLNKRAVAHLGSSLKIGKLPLNPLKATPFHSSHSAHVNASCSAAPVPRPFWFSMSMHNLNLMTNNRCIRQIFFSTSF